MTPAIAHKISLKLEPYKKRLIVSLCVFIVLDVLTWMFAFIALANTKAESVGFYIVVFPHLGVFWSGGLLFLHFMFRKLPNRETMTPIVYSWNRLMGYPSTIFVAIWFLGLSLITLAVPISLVARAIKVLT